MKKFTALLLTALNIILLCGKESPAQQMPKTPTLKLSAGEYTLTILLSRRGRISGLSYRNNELFCSSTASAGTDYEPFPKESLSSLKITVDGQVPGKVDPVVKGSKIIVERSAVYGTINLFSRFELTADGLLWSNRYQIISETAKPKYFWLFTMPWSTGFTEFHALNKGNIKSGKFTNSAKWLVQSEIEKLVICNPSIQTAVLIRPLTPIPTDSRRHHSIWDHKAYHKYFLLHKTPTWKQGFTSPEYAITFSAKQISPKDTAETLLETDCKNFSK